MISKLFNGLDEKMMRRVLKNALICGLFNNA
jgi:hypothetical protein